MRRVDIGHFDTHLSTNLVTRGPYHQQVHRAGGGWCVEGTMGHRPIINITIKKKIVTISMIVLFTAQFMNFYSIYMTIIKIV